MEVYHLNKANAALTVQQFSDRLMGCKERNLSFDIIGSLGIDSKTVIGLQSSAGYGKVIGRQSADGKLIWRLDYDPNK